MTALEIAAAVQRGARRAADVAEDALEGLHAAPPGSIRAMLPEAARAAAARVDAAVARGDDPGSLAGVPVAIKDNIVIAGEETTGGSRILSGYRSPFTATAVARLIEAGAVPVAITNCDEFAMGSTGAHCAHGRASNPWHDELVTGGSSSGSAALVGAGLVPLALGSDTGGSIRQPAAFCGAVGLKPSYGRVSRFGLMAYGSSLDQIGPFARTVDDAAAALMAMWGRDPRDSTSADVAQVDLIRESDARSDAPLRLGVLVDQLDHARTDPAVRSAISDTLGALERSGDVSLVELELGIDDFALAAYYVIASAEASSNLARYDGVRYGRRADLSKDASLETLYVRSRSEGFGPEAQRRIMLGTYVLSAGYADRYYHRALKARRLVADRFGALFESCDVLAGPTSPTLPFPASAPLDPIDEFACDAFTVPANLAGICAMSVPCATTARDGATVPIGVQLQAPVFDERGLITAGRLVERAANATFRPLEATRT